MLQKITYLCLLFFSSLLKEYELILTDKEVEGG